MKAIEGPRHLMSFVQKMNRPVFTTHELAMLSGKSASTVVQSLSRLVKQRMVIRICRGVWGEAMPRRISPFEVIPSLFPRGRAYVSFLTALHLHGMVEQIPQVITLASTCHTRRIRTCVGDFSVHQIAPSFFDGFGWYKESGFLIAEPEKALIDSLYLSSRKKRQFGAFPELHYPDAFSFEKAVGWIRRIRNPKIRLCVQGKFDKII